MSDSSIRVNPSIEDPSNCISPSRALLNWLRGISTFLMTPRISVNCSLRNRTFCASQTFRISDLPSPGPDASNFSTFPFSTLAMTSSVLCKSGAILCTLPPKSSPGRLGDTKNLPDLHNPGCIVDAVAGEDGLVETDAPRARDPPAGGSLIYRVAPGFDSGREDHRHLNRLA